MDGKHSRQRANRERNNVSAYGLAVEHYQQYEVEWNGQGGKVVFFRNENPYDPPSQSAWMASSTQDWYPAFYIPNSVTTFQGYGMGSYCFFNQGVAIENAMAFQAPATSGVVFTSLLTVFLNGSGGIVSVINGTGAAVSSSSTKPSDIRRTIPDQDATWPGTAYPEPPPTVA